MKNVKLWEILVPVSLGRKKFSKKHHQKWDKYVTSLSGGLTLLRLSKGKWLCPYSHKLYEEKMISVRVACKKDELMKIIDFTMKHYKQKAVMAYQVSNAVLIVGE